MVSALVHSKQISHALCLGLSTVLPHSSLTSPILEEFIFEQEKCLKYAKLFNRTRSLNIIHINYLEKGKH